MAVILNLDTSRYFKNLDLVGNARSERFSGVAARPFDCNSFEASLSVTTPLVAKMARDVASPWTRAAIFTVRPK